MAHLVRLEVIEAIAVAQRATRAPAKGPQRALAVEHEVVQRAARHRHGPQPRRQPYEPRCRVAALGGAMAREVARAELCPLGVAKAEQYGARGLGASRVAREQHDR
eukprot:3015434-Prymnesium_polylepis.1